jgi:hypothetical protein
MSMFALWLKAFLDAQSNYSNKTINNFVNYHAKNMIWASFESNFNVLLAYKFSQPKTGWDRSRPVFDRSICFLNLLDRGPDCGLGLFRSINFPVISGSVPVQSRSFSSLETRLPSTKSGHSTNTCVLGRNAKYSVYMIKDMNRGRV